MIGLAVAALILKGASSAELPMLATKAQFDQWVGAFYRKQIVSLKDERRSIVVVGADVGSGLPVMSVRILERLDEGYVTRCTAMRTGFDRITASIPRGKHSVRVDGLLSWPTPLSGMKRKGLLFEYGM